MGKHGWFFMGSCFTHQQGTTRNLGVLCGGRNQSTKDTLKWWPMSNAAKMARTQINIPISNILFWIGNNFSMEYSHQIGKTQNIPTLQWIDILSILNSVTLQSFLPQKQEVVDLFVQTGQGIKVLKLAKG